MRNQIRVLLSALLLIAAIASTGCNYMRNRGNDALDMFDIGITVSPKLQPDFQVYLGFLGSIPIGGAYVDNAKLIGIGNHHPGLWIDYENKSYGAVLWGSEKQGCGEFDARDPYQAREDQRNLTERPRFNTGPVRDIVQGNPVPPLHFVECDKGVHIGYIGVLANCRLLEIVDFIVGWTTLDIVGDDDAAYRK